MLILVILMILMTLMVLMTLLILMTLLVLMIPKLQTNQGMMLILMNPMN